MNNKIVGAIVILAILSGASVFIYNWKAIAPNTIQTTTTATKISQMMGRVKIPDNGCYLGATAWDYPLSSTQLAKVRSFESMVGKKLAIVNVNWLWMESAVGVLDRFPREGLENVVRGGAIPMIGSWAMRINSTTAKVSPANSQDVIEGRCDKQLAAWAAEAKTFSYPFLLRLGYEMNIGSAGGYPFPFMGVYGFGPYGNRTWSEVDNLYKYYGDSSKPDGPERFVDAWRHIHDVFSVTGANNVLWVWCPLDLSIPDLQWNNSENYYPRDDYVDWVACDLYNSGYWQGKTLWIDFCDRFKINHGQEIYTRHSNKPFMLAEMGCSEESLPGVPGPKARWITNAYNSIKNSYSNIKAIVWFSKDKQSIGERDWRVDSSPESLEAYRKAISDTYFLDRIIIEKTSSTAPPTASFLVLPTMNRASGQRGLKH